MPVATFGGKPVAAKPSPKGPVLPDPETPDRVVLFMRLVAMSCEARRDLQQAVAALREIDVDALNDPALADHPRLPAMRQLYHDRQRDEHAATVRLIEVNVSLERQWGQIPPAEKARYGLTFIVGEPDPQANILVRLWGDDAGLARLVPFPNDWTIPNDISHRVFDVTPGVNDVSRAELFNSPHAPF